MASKCSVNSLKTVAAGEWDSPSAHHHRIRSFAVIWAHGGDFQVQALIDAHRPLDARSLYLEFADDSSGSLKKGSEA